MVSVEEMKVLGVGNGSEMVMEIYMITMLNDIISSYNNHTSTPLALLNQTTPTTLSCTIVGFLDSPYEKYPDFESQVIMEYGLFTTYLADNLPAPLDENADFVAFMKGELPF